MQCAQERVQLTILSTGTATYVDIMTYVQLKTEYKKTSQQIRSAKKIYTEGKLAWFDGLARQCTGSIFLYFTNIMQDQKNKKQGRKKISIKEQH